jgi:Kef-type K+ transport system membrane component KefB
MSSEDSNVTNVKNERIVNIVFIAVNTLFLLASIIGFVAGSKNNKNLKICLGLQFLVSLAFLIVGAYFQNKYSQTLDELKNSTDKEMNKEIVLSMHLSLIPTYLAVVLALVYGFFLRGNNSNTGENSEEQRE